LWPDYPVRMLVCLTLPDGVKCLTGFAHQTWWCFKYLRAL